MKKLLIVLVVLVALLAIILASVFYLTAGVTDTADGFFSAIEEKDIEGAYNRFASEEFRASTSLEEFRAFLEQSALANYSGATWTSRSVSGQEGELQGSVKTRDGGTVPITITLVKEAGEWRILSIHKASAGLVDEQAGKTVPPVEDLRRLTNESMMALAMALNARDFGDFYNRASVYWQSQTNVEELMGAFKSFIDQNIDLTVIDGMEPVFDEVPVINDDDLLILKGYYATRPSATHFELKHIYEHPDWKLFGINVSIR
jgi:hypothetical protein